MVRGRTNSTLVVRLIIPSQSGKYRSENEWAPQAPVLLSNDSTFQAWAGRIRRSEIRRFDPIPEWSMTKTTPGRCRWTS